MIKRYCDSCQSVMDGEITDIAKVELSVKPCGTQETFILDCEQELCKKCTPKFVELMENFFVVII